MTSPSLVEEFGLYTAWADECARDWSAQVEGWPPGMQASMDALAASVRQGGTYEEQDVPFPDPVKYRLLVHVGLNRALTVIHDYANSLRGMPEEMEAERQREFEAVHRITTVLAASQALAWMGWMEAEELPPDPMTSQPYHPEVQTVTVRADTWEGFFAAQIRNILPDLPNVEDAERRAKVNAALEYAAGLLEEAHGEA